MSQDPTLTIQECFQDIEDPRASNSRHQLTDIITIAILAAVCGADTWVEVEKYGKAKEAWLAQYLSLPHGIPSHDTFGRVFAVLDPEQFQESFVYWVKTVHTVAGNEVVAVDGKRLRRSHDRTNGKAALHMVSAWAVDSRVVLGQWAVDSKSNEITAIPELLDRLALKDCIITIDALNCQRTIAAKIVDQQADYVMAVKKNHKDLYHTLDLLFHATTELNAVDPDYHQTLSKGHGRVEHRECWITDDTDYLDYIAEKADWPGLQSLIMIKTVRQTPEERTVKRRYFISTLPPDAELALQTVRTHWHVENRLHWVLDIGFREDESRVRKGHSAANFAAIRHIALNLLKHEETAECGIHAKRLRAGWDNEYLLNVLDV